jgi:cytochrome c oxidase assembly protein subunit 15
VRLAHRLALGTAVATAVLIVFGGLVTNTGAALAVPDWPNTFGHNLFLYPWSGMIGGVFYEHSHRLLGAAVGLLTVALAAALWRRGPALRVLGLIAVATVIAQGVLGGLRVVLLRDELALVHGPLAQAFFALITTLAYLTSPAATIPASVDGGLRRLAIAGAALIYAQIVLGALLTHAGWLWLHVGGAFAVFAVLPVLTARARRTGDAIAAPLSRVLLALLGLQLALGVGAYLARFSPLWIPGEQATMLILPVAHRLVGGLILAGTVVLAVRLNADSIAGVVGLARDTADIARRDDVRFQRERGGMGEAADVRFQRESVKISRRDGVPFQRERGGMGEAADVRLQRESVKISRRDGVRFQRERGGMGEAEGVPHLK